MSVSSDDRGSDLGRTVPRRLLLVHPPMFGTAENGGGALFSTETIDFCEGANETTTLQCDVMMLGDGGVGKTSLVGRATTGRFSNRYLATIGIDYRAITYRILDNDDGRRHPPVLLRSLVWDTAGQERFGGRLTRSYYSRANAFLVVFDVTSQRSLLHVSKILDDGSEVVLVALRYFIMAGNS